MIKDKIKNSIHPITKPEENKLLWWLKRNKERLVNIIAGNNSSGGSSSGTSGASGGTNKAFLRVSQHTTQESIFIFIEGSKEEIFEKLNNFDAFDVEYINPSLDGDGYGNIERASCLCHVNKQIEDYGTVKAINIFVPFPEVNNQMTTGNLMGISINLFKSNDSDTYAIDANANITENASLVMENETYTGIVISFGGR